MSVVTQSFRFPSLTPMIGSLSQALELTPDALVVQRIALVFADTISEAAFVKKSIREIIDELSELSSKNAALTETFYEVVVGCAVAEVSRSSFIKERREAAFGWFSAVRAEGSSCSLQKKSIKHLVEYIQAHRARAVS